MASGHVNRVNRPNTWLHRPMLQNVKKALANSEPSTHGAAARDAVIVSGMSAVAAAPARAARRVSSVIGISLGWVHCFSGRARIERDGPFNSFVGNPAITTKFRYSFLNSTGG